MTNKLIEIIKNKVSKYKNNNNLLCKWSLYEYYIDQEDGLLNMKEERLQSEGLFWYIEFHDNGTLKFDSNLKVSLIEGMNPSAWEKSKSIVNLTDDNVNNKSIKFQYAFDKGNLKMLKKHPSGQIEIFAFFRREE